MRTCASCGAIMTDDETKCPKCGALVNGFNAKEKAQTIDVDDSAVHVENGSAGSSSSGYSQNSRHAYDHTDEFSQQDIQETKVMCILAYLGILFFLPLVVYPNSKVGRFHANQGLILLIVSVILSVLISTLTALGMIPLIGFLFRIVGYITSTVTGLVMLGAFLYELFNIIGNRAVELPLVGRIRFIR